MNFDADTLRFIMLVLVTMVFSGSVHEWAHAYAAFKLGDDTAARQGRLTLNPSTHIDPFGTLLMPAIGAMYGFLFGYMRPVPFNPVRFTRRFSMKTGTLIVASAGPLSNLVLAFVCGAILKIISVSAGPQIFTESDVAGMFGALLVTGIWLNAVLAIFNLLPIYPLDGSKILEGILPRKYQSVLDFIQQNSLIFMILIFAVGARFLTGPIRVLIQLVLRTFGLGFEWSLIHGTYL